MLDQSHAICALLSPVAIPLWLKLFYTLFVCLIAAVNWVQYGPGNFLWFSDIALFVTVPALWLESPLLASMMALAVLLLELAWGADLFVRLITGVSLTGLSSYMFDPKIPLPIRAVSLFHIPLPVVLVWMLYRHGYDSRALVAQTVLAWIVLPLSYLLTDRSENVNWVYGFGEKQRKWMPPSVHVILLMVLLPLAIYLPSHLLLKRIFG